MSRLSNITNNLYIMRIAITTYPMLWQRTGGLQTQILKTTEHLLNKNIDIHLFDSLNERLNDYDIVHVFGNGSGVHRILQEAKAQGVCTIYSPILQPSCSRLKFARYAVASWLTSKITSYEINTSHNDICLSVECSDHLIALSKAECGILKKLYGVTNEHITLIPNGIDSCFFKANPALFSEQYKIEPGFILIVGSISSYKNQLSVIRATADMKLVVILIGPVGDSEYMNQCLEEGGERVRYIGILAHNDPLLSSAYAAAGVTILASAGEAFGLTVVESLASGTPAIITASNGLDLSPCPSLSFVDPHDIMSLQHTIHAALTAQQPTASQCQELVAHLKWEVVGDKIIQVYKKLNAMS